MWVWCLLVVFVVHYVFDGLLAYFGDFGFFLGQFQAILVELLAFAVDLGVVELVDLFFVVGVGGYWFFGGV